MKTAPKTGNPLRRNESRAAILFLLPSVIGFFLFMAGPTVASFVIALTDWPLIRGASWTGIGNVREILTDRLFWVTLRNTGVYTFIKVPLNMILSLIVAVLLNRRMAGRTVYRVVFFLPMILSSVAVGMVWRPLLGSSDVGLVNRVLSLVGIGAVPWLSSSTWAMPSLIGVAIWKEMGYFMVIFLAGLQGIPRTYYEAADIDGAGPVRSFFAITVPLVSPTTLFVFVTSIIGSFQIFDLSTILTGGGPGNATNTLVMYVYQAGFRFLRMGYASALAMVLFLIILILTVVQHILSKHWVYTE